MVSSRRRQPGKRRVKARRNRSRTVSRFSRRSAAAPRGACSSTSSRVPVSRRNAPPSPPGGPSRPLQCRSLCAQCSADRTTPRRKTPPDRSSRTKAPAVSGMGSEPGSIATGDCATSGSPGSPAKVIVPHGRRRTGLYIEESARSSPGRGAESHRRSRRSCRPRSRRNHLDGGHQKVPVLRHSGRLRHRVSATSARITSRSSSESTRTSQTSRVPGFI